METINLKIIKNFNNYKIKILNKVKNKIKYKMNKLTKAVIRSYI